MTPLFAQADFLGPAGLKSVLMHLQLSVRVTLCFFFYIFKVFIKAKARCCIREHILKTV